MAGQTGNYRQNFTSVTNRGRSPAVWGDMPLLDIAEGAVEGISFFDDFTDFGIAGTQTTQINLGRYKVYNTGSGVVETINAFPTTEYPGGIIRMLADTAGDQSVIGTAATPFVLNSAAGGGKFAFEARIAITGIATNNIQMILGLGENRAMTFGAAQPLADADAAQTTGGLLGAHLLEDGLGVLNNSYEDRSATWTDVETGIATMAAHTWLKYGIKWDPDYPDQNRVLRFFVNNLECANAVSATTFSALTHLDAKGLGLIFATFADSAGTSTYAYLDWWGAAQVLN